MLFFMHLPILQEEACVIALQPLELLSHIHWLHAQVVFEVCM